MGFNSRLGRTEEISELGDRSADKYSNWSTGEMSGKQGKSIKDMCIMLKISSVHVITVLECKKTNSCKPFKTDKN